MEATTTQTGTQNVLVAARDLAPGTVLEESDLRWEPWPEKLVDARVITQPAQGQATAGAQNPQQDFVAHIVRRSVMSGEPMS